jgi:histidine kinase 2/3/4 (cytokinin receptor)
VPLFLASHRGGSHLICIWITFLHCLQLCRFEATRRIRSLENKFNEEIASGEASIEMFGNEPRWHTPILAMTADVIQASNEECMKCGMDDYVSKPFEEGQLYSAVAHFF